MLLAPISACTATKAETLPELSPDPEKSLVEAPAAFKQDSERTDTTESADTPVDTKTYWPWSDTPAQKPPPVKPYRLPTLSGDQLHFRDRPPALVKAPAIDADAVYDYVLACFPEDSKWDLDINLRGQLANRGGSILDTGGAGNTELGSSYVAIVASMPLYSSTEINREKEREYTRRQNVASTVADFITAIASRNHALREMALYRSLEARAALRVQQGIVEAAEQVQYLEKVAGSQETLVKQEAKIMESRLKLAGMCDPINAKPINAWLKTVSKVPLRDPPPGDKPE